MISINSFIKIVPLKEFEGNFPELITTKSNFFAYFYGGYDVTGDSWCSDCVVSKPIIEEAQKLLEGQTKVRLFKFPIDDRLEWKKQDFIYRIHPKVKLDRVPTLIYYQNGIEFGRLTEDELFDKSNVEEFIKQSLE
jgi:thiol-disulfide isomerase/thioredoxin